MIVLVVLKMKMAMDRSREIVPANAQSTPCSQSMP
jgi:hypothetical protein